MSTRSFGTPQNLTFVATDLRCCKAFTAKNVARYDAGELPHWLPATERTDSDAKASGAYDVYTKITYRGIGADWLSDLAEQTTCIGSVLWRGEADVVDAFAADIETWCEANLQLLESLRETHGDLLVPAPT